MAYGNGDKNTLKRMISLGVGDLTDAKLCALADLREGYIAVANRFSQAVFVTEPLAGLPTRQETGAQLVTLQREMTGLSKFYVEKARLAVDDHVNEQYRRYHHRLVGSLAHCHEKIAESDEKPRTKKKKDQDKPARRYFQVPEAIQDSITPEELTGLARLPEARGFQGTLALFRAVVLDGKTEGLSDNQVAVIRDIHQRALARHHGPVYGADPEFVCQLHLDYRVIREAHPKACIQGLDRTAARLLIDEKNRRYYAFLEISSPVPRGEPIRIPLVLREKLLKRLLTPDETPMLKDGRLSSLVVEIGPRRVEVKAVVSKPKPKKKSLNDCDHLMGRDFGYRNTVALVTVRRDAEIDEATVKALTGMTKDEAKTYLEEHGHPAEGVVSQVVFSGKRFLKRIETHATHIDTLRSEIDHLYQRIGRLKGVLSGYYGLAAHEHIDPHSTPDDPLMAKVQKRFFAALDHVRHLKQLRRARYRKIAQIKKCWFGFLSNIEVKLAKAYNAALIREDLTVMATEKDTPQYKGRTFNKMINNGSKGQYIRRADDKHHLNGVPVVAVPSAYTSSTCVIHHRVDKAMRKNETFNCPDCQTPRCADLNAAMTIAYYLLLQRAVVTNPA